MSLKKKNILIKELPGFCYLSFSESEISSRHSENPLKEKKCQRGAFEYTGGTIKKIKQARNY